MGTNIWGYKYLDSYKDNVQELEEKILELQKIHFEYNSK